MFGCWTPFTRVLMVICLLWSASPPDAAASSVLDLDDRIRYQGRLEQTYADQRTPSAPVSTKITETPTDSELRAKIEKQLKMGDALEQVWGLRIDRDDLQAEYERIIAHSNDREMLGRLLDVLDRDPDTVAACLVEPILVRRAIHGAYWWDTGIHADSRQTAEGELLTNDNEGGLGWSSGERTETEWRVAAEGESLGTEYENGVQVRALSRETWNRLHEEFGRRWETAADPGDDLPTLRFSPLEETKEYFSAAVILGRTPTSIRIATYTWWKRTFSAWWNEHAAEFSARIPDSRLSIDMERALFITPLETETKDRVVAADAWFPMDSSDPDTPIARTKHTAVWNGNLMIVWGGTDGASYFSSGGVYDPATDSWSATSQGTGCPQPRIGHSANWLNNRMYIWGGWRGVSNFADGAIYNPATDSWVSMAEDANTPQPRRDHAGLNLIEDDALYIWGGIVDGSPSDSGAIYRAGAWSAWPSSSGTPSDRTDFVSVVDDAFGSFVVWGGQGDFSNPDDGGKFDVDPPGWDDIPAAGAPLSRTGATGVESGGVCTSSPVIIIWGGDSDTIGYLDTGGIYSPVGDGAWVGATPGGDNLPNSRIGHTAVMDTAMDRMIIWGGSTPSYGSVDTGGVLDLCDDSWTATNLLDPDLPDRRLNHTAVWTGKTMIVWGGNFAGAEYNDGGVYTHCWGAPTTSLTPTVADEDSCAVTGIRVSWSSTPDWKDYAVHRTVAVLRDGSVIASELLPSDGSYLDTSAVEDQSYDYQIRFINSCDESTTTTSVSGVDQASSTPTVTVGPTAVDADGCSSASGIDISWSADPDGWGDNESGDRKYRVWRWRNSTEDWVAQGTQIDYGTTSYHDPNPNLGKYRVKYINGCGKTTDSPETEMIYDMAGAAPTVSQTVVADDANACVHSGNRITWPADPDDWGDGGTGNRVYRVRRSSDGVNFNPIGDNIAYGTISYVDAAASPDREYSYQVRYKNGCDLSSDSGMDTATDVDGESPITGFNAAASDPDTCDDGGVVITWPQDGASWGDGDSGTRSYEIERGGTTIHTGITYGTTTYTDNSGANGTPYTYRVRMVNGCGLSGLSGISSSVADLPAAPSITLTNNTATDVDDCAATGVIVTWSADPDGGWGDDGSGARTYEVHRDGAILQSGIAYGFTTYIDTTGTPGTPYVYTVRYVNCGALHSETTGVTATDINGTPATPAPPVVADASACAQDGVWINWAPSAGAATYDLRVDEATEITGVFDPILYDPGDSSLHTYEVRANGVSCPGSWSQSTALSDLIDPDARFCDGFRSGDTSVWAVTSP